MANRTKNRALGETLGDDEATENKAPESAEPVEPSKYVRSDSEFYKRGQTLAREAVDVLADPTQRLPVEVRDRMTPAERNAFVAGYNEERGSIVPATPGYGEGSIVIDDTGSAIDDRDRRR